MNNMQAVIMPQLIFGDISVCSEEYHSEYFIAAPSFNEGTAIFGAPLMYKENYGQNVAQMTYGNLDRVNYTYDSVDRLTKKTYSDSDAEVQYFYNSNGEMYRVKDGLASRSTLFEYDLAGRIVGISVTSLNGSEQYAHIGTRYEDGTGNVKSQSATMFNSDGTVANSLVYNYTYCGAKSGYDPAALARYSFDGVLYTYEYDRLGRLVTRKSSIASTESGPLSQQINGGKSESYTYVDVTTGSISKTTTLVYKYTDIQGVVHEFDYDANGNIISEKIGDEIKTYEYDSQNRLIRYDDSALGVTYVYTYDNRGNILNYRYMDYVPAGTSVSETDGDTYTFSYTNNVLKDAVTAINGETITYDSSYNPLKWTNGRTLTWVQGRRLETVTDGSTVTTYTYDENGIRVAKNVSSGGRSTQYYVADGTYLGEKTTYRGVTFLITYLYGDSGIVGIEVNGTKYFFVKNLQGDVTGIIDSTGAVIANYAYDAYGFCYSVTDASGNTITSASHIANINPFRYRSYMYDTETGFYYIYSRYFDPDIGRWLSPEPNVYSGEFDEGAGLLMYNIFAYCANNPIVFKDDNGESITLTCILVGTAIGLIVGGSFGAYRANKNGYTPSDGWKYWKYVVGYGVAGGAIGALVGWGAGALIAKYGVATAATSITKGGGARFATFKALKNSLGSAGQGRQWHHIVEQCQLKSTRAGFSKYWIHNSNNVINLSNDVHQLISNFYSSIPNPSVVDTGGMVFRDWITNMSFEQQYKWGIWVMRYFGVEI